MEEIKAVCFVSGKGGPVPLEALDEGRREALSRWLRESYLTELCRGKATVRWDTAQRPATERHSEQAEYSFGHSKWPKE